MSAPYSFDAVWSLPDASRVVSSEAVQIGSTRLNSTKFAMRPSVLSGTPERAFRQSALETAGDRRHADRLHRDSVFQPLAGLHLP